MKRARELSPGGYHESRMMWKAKSSECVKQDLNLDRDIPVTLGNDSNRYVRDNLQ